MPVTKHEDKRSTIDVSGITVTGGQTLKLETSPSGEEILAEVCPEGETWTVHIHVQISITD